MAFNLVYTYRRKTKETRRVFIAFLRLSDGKSKKRLEISFMVDTRRVKEEMYPPIGTKIRDLILRKINDLEK